MSKTAGFRHESGRFLGVMALIGFIFLGMCPAANAQESAASDNSDNTAVHSQVIPEVVVTAQKREENVQEVPISLSVISGEMIEDAGIDTVTDLTFFTPNVYSKQNVNQNMLIIRGISSHNVVLNTPAGLFVDDINYPLTFMQNPDLLDVERVEILRGPQGTLYGRNTESGAVRIVTRQPGNELRGTVFMEPGFYDTLDRNSLLFKAGASVSGPLVEDNLYLGVAFQTVQSDGYTENIFDGDDKAGKTNRITGQAKLRWTPGEKWDVSLIGNAYKSDDGYGLPRYQDGPSQTERYKINWDGANRWEDNNNGQALRIKYMAGSFDVVSITVRNDFVTEFDNDGEFGPLDFGDQEWRFSNLIYSQELRLSSSKKDSPLKWLAGVYLFSEEVEADAGFFGQFRQTEQDNLGYAAFGQATYTLFKRLHITAGLRLDFQDSEVTQKNIMVPEPYSADIDHSQVLPKGSVSYDITEDIMAYATVAKGFLAGGFNYAFANGPDTLTFDPETTWNYEIGMKSGWFDNKLIANASIFYIDIFDKQVEEWLAGPGARSVTNAAEASSMGFELELQARPLAGLHIFGGLGYTDATIDEWVSDEFTGGNFDYSGRQLPFAPKYTYNAGAEYLHSTGLFGRADLIGVSNFYSDAKNENEIDGYNVFNLRLGYKAASYEVSLWCKNLFDEDYITNKSNYVSGTLIEDGLPRTYGIKLTYRF